MDTIIRAAQACYDVWLDAFGVRVGTYRKNLCIATSAGSFMAYHRDASAMVSAIPVAGLVWLLFVTSRPRAKQDDADQGRRLYAAVNARALASAAGLVSDLCVFALLCTLFCILLRSTIAEAVVLNWSYCVLQLNQCLMVRERNTTRFSFKRFFPSGARAAAQGSPS